MATYGSSKSNVLAVVKEVTAGTPVDPSSGSDYVALQSDFQMAPNFEQLTNDEIRASIGKSKTIQGLEQPEGGFSHYMKASGVEGTPPEIGDLLESAFGATSANSTQRTTTTSSTTSVVKLAAGGSDFARGKAVLVKDGTNGYNIRPVHSVSTNDLTLGFNLPNGPASGVNTGKCVNFSPANSGHPSLTLHAYRGNGQALEVLAGALVQEMTIDAKAGQNINTNFSFQGTKYHFNPIRIAAADTKLDFEDSSGALVATVTAKLYRSPQELAQAIQDSMNAQGSVDTFTVTYDNATGKFTFTSNGSAFELNWNTGANTANTIGDKIGFLTAADDTGSLTYTSDNAQSYASPYTPSFDSADPVAAKNLEILLGDAADASCFCAQEVSIKLTNTITNVLCICAESGVDQKKVTERRVTIAFKALLPKYDADKFNRYATNQETRFAFNFGPKSGGNWVPGKCGNVYVPTCTVSKFQVTDLDSMIGIDVELEGFVDSSGNGEVYLNFL